MNTKLGLPDPIFIDQLHLPWAASPMNGHGWLYLDRNGVPTHAIFTRVTPPRYPGHIEPEETQFVVPASAICWARPEGLIPGT